MEDPIVETPVVEEPAEVTGTLLIPEDAVAEPELIGSIPGLPTREELAAAEEAKPDEPVVKEPPVANPVEDEPAPEVETPLPEDPGEFKPTDNSFSVDVFDEDGKKTKTVKIASIQEWDDLLETDPNLGSSAALLKAQRQATKMESATEGEQADWQKKKDDYDNAVTARNESVAQANRWQAEINYLVGKGELPVVSKELANADWSDPEVAKQPGVKEQLELLDYMRKESAVRVKAGLSKFTSILDAYNAWQLDKGRIEADTTKKKAAEARKAAGARVATSSSAPTSTAPKGIAVGRGGSLRDLDNLFFG